MSQKSAAVIGSTGHVGSRILSQLLASPDVANVVSVQRRDTKDPSPKLHALVSTDHDAWPNLFKDKLKSVTPPVSALFSGLATTRAMAGGLKKQYAIDHGLNLTMATAAKEAGIETYVIISSGGANSASKFPYTQMKGQLDDDVIKLGFKRTVIARPGYLAGDRGDQVRPWNGEGTASMIYNGLKAVIGDRAVDFWAVQPDVVARAVIKAAYAPEGEYKGDEKGVWILSHGDIVRMGKENK